MSTVVQSIESRRVRFGSIEPAVIVLLKQLEPVVVVLSLAVCEWAHGVRFSWMWGALALPTFIVSGRLFPATADPRDFDSLLESISRKVPHTLMRWGFTVALLLLTTTVLNIPEQLPRPVFLDWLVAAPAALLALQALRVAVRWSAAQGALAPRYIIIGANDVGFELARRLPTNGFSGFFDFRNFERVSHGLDATSFVGHCNEVAEYVRVHGIRAVYIALPMSNVPRIAGLINALRDTTASVHFVLDAFSFDLTQSRVIDLNGIPALSVCDTPFHGMDAVVKRVMDLTLATIVLALSLPLMTSIAVAVKLTSRGPVLFRQRRYGLNGEQITVYKFRSMSVCEDGAVVNQAKRCDPRVTWVGRLIRKTSLDELPQIFNVLAGTMSLVGPRPHAVAHNEQYRKLINGYMIRHKVRPGITGWAQVHGLRGETANVEKMAERVHYDLEYLRHWSPWLDIKILAKTLTVLVKDHHNAY